MEKSPHAESYKCENTIVSQEDVIKTNIKSNLDIITNESLDISKEKKLGVANQK